MAPAIIFVPLAPIIKTTIATTIFTLIVLPTAVNGVKTIANKFKTNKIDSSELKEMVAAAKALNQMSK